MNRYNVCRYCVYRNQADICNKCDNHSGFLPNFLDTTLTPNEYQKKALRTEKGGIKLYPRILNGLMGLNGEAGEAIDLLKKHMFQGHTLDKEHLAKELGDIAWYLAISADAIGYRLEDILRMNIEKLDARYPAGFDSDRSVNREENDI